VDSAVQEGILQLFADRETRTWDLGGAMQFRDRVGLPIKDLLNSPEAVAALAGGKPWRIVPGGSSVRAGVYLAPGVTIIPPSFINIGAWIGEGTMVDSHALVGSCAQIGARVHLSAGVQIGGVLEPAGRRPVILEDEVFVGAQAALLEGVLVQKGAVIAAGVILTGTSRLYDLVHERVIVGTLEAPLVVPPGAVVAPGVRQVAGEFAAANGLALSAAIIVKYRDERTDARVALEEALR
jgi:2,3,4,5-tetrahydropyridine-2-carboxylate N-succinyltransferase